MNSSADQPESLDLARDLEKRFDRLLDQLTMSDLFRELNL